MSDCDALRHDLGGYVLGGLEPRERQTLEQHLGTCPVCARELDELANLPALLALAAQAPPTPPGRLRERVLARAVARRVRRRWAVAAAAAVVLAAVFGGLITDRMRSTPPEVALALEPVEPFEAEGWALLREQPSGVTIELEVQGLDPPPAGGVYEAWLSTRDDDLVSVGFVHPDGAGAATVTLAAEGTLGRYRSFWVTAEPDTTSAHDGPTVLRARLPAARR